MNDTWLKEGFEKGEKVAVAKTTISHYNGILNLSEIATILIQNVGRFVERYADDFLYTWRSVENLASSENISYSMEPFQDIVIFALRKNGVDGVNGFHRHLRDYAWSLGFKDKEEARVSPGPYYRKVFAVSVSCDQEKDEVMVELRDVENVLFRIPADE